MSDNPAFGLYLHWPFCQSKCPYCDFNSHVASRIDQRRWRDAYLSEISRLGRETPGRILSSVFFGGGTPSLMDPDLVADILQAVQRTWQMTNDPEITLEANPGSVEASRFGHYRQAGVNRVSVGVQALDDGALRQLGRQHSSKEAIRAVEIAMHNFPRVNFDLIYARQGQDLRSWEAELKLALSLSPSHLSLYQLTIEEGTVFHARWSRGQLVGLPDEDTAADLYARTHSLCDDAGLHAYEVSNHALAGEESRHNLIYWRGGDYVGIGPGAHGRLPEGGIRRATECIKEPFRWLSAVEEGRPAELDRVSLSPVEHATEYLMMGLRLHEGVSARRLDTIHPGLLNPTAIAELVELGMLDASADSIMATKSGMPLLNSILRKLLAGS